MFSLGKLKSLIDHPRTRPPAILRLQTFVSDSTQPTSSQIISSQPIVIEDSQVRLERPVLASVQQVSEYTQTVPIEKKPSLCLVDTALVVLVGNPMRSSACQTNALPAVVGSETQTDTVVTACASTDCLGLLPPVKDAGDQVGEEISRFLAESRIEAVYGIVRGLEDAEKKRRRIETRDQTSQSTVANIQTKVKAKRTVAISKPRRTPSRPPVNRPVADDVEYISFLKRPRLFRS